jgi:hypothetical protein
MLVFHGVTDAPAVSIGSLVPSVSPLITGIHYGEFQGYLSLPVANYVIQVTDSAGVNAIKTYDATLSIAAGLSVVAYASGFLDSTQNKNGKPFGIYVTVGGDGSGPLDGATLSLPDHVTGIDEVKVLDNMNVYPNPVTNNASVNFNLKKDARVEYRLTNMLGQQIQYTDFGKLTAGENTQSIDLSSLSNGSYIMTLVIDNQTTVVRNVVVTK